MTLALFVLRAAVILACALLATTLLRRGPAGVRRGILVVALGATLALPLAGLLPARAPLRVPVVLQVDRVAAPPATPAPRGAVAAQVPRRVSTPFPWSRALVALWLAGGLVVATRFGRAFLRARSLGRGGERVALDSVVAAEVEVPAVVGLIAARIVLPVAWHRWPAAKRHAVLLHERAHIAQRDPLARLVSVAACTVYWFLPLAWLAARRLRRECEIAADERVLAQGVLASTYAGYLLEVAQSLVTSVPEGALSIASELEARIVALTSPPRRAWSRARRVSAAVATVALCALVACTGAADPGSSSIGTRGATTDARVQSIVDDEAARVQREWSATSVSIVVLDPSSGAILAMHGDAQRAVVPGSTLKSLTVAAALEAHAIDANESFDCAPRAYGANVLEDATPHGSLDASAILGVSSNVGASRIFDRLGPARWRAALERVHLGEAPGALPAAIDDNDYVGALAASGVGVLATPLQIAAAYGALADGNYRQPTFSQGGSAGERVFSEATARDVVRMLSAAVTGDGVTGAAAAVPGITVAGKTGTCGDDGRYASFVGLAPAERPRYVVFVGLGTHDPRAAGGNSAAPAFSRIVSRVFGSGN